MKGNKILVNQRQFQKWHLLGLVEGGKISLKEASEKIGVSYRETKRIWKAVKKRGIRGLIHGNAGRTPPNQVSDLLKKLDIEIRSW